MRPSQQYKDVMTDQQNDLLREKLKLEIVWFNTDTLILFSFWLTRGTYL